MWAPCPQVVKEEQAYFRAEAQQAAQKAEDPAVTDEDSDSSWSMNTSGFGAFRALPMSVSAVLLVSEMSVELVLNPKVSRCK